MRRRILVALFVLAALLVTPAAWAAEAVDLYTVGPGDYFFSRYGHSLLCVRDAMSAPAAGADADADADADAADAKGRCFDYGVPDRDDTLHVGWTAARNQPSFATVGVPEAAVLKFFRDQGRKIERQRLLLSNEEVERLVTRLDTDVRTRWTYAYHPYWANCSTQIRDRIDEATQGRLHVGPTHPPKDRFRELMEQGLTGRIPELVGLTLFLGPASDRPPTAWESMFLPDVLRDGVAERFAAPPQQVAEHLAVVLPTSRAIGRVTLFVAAIVLGFIVRFLVRRGRKRAALMLVGIALGVFALAVDVVAASFAWPEIQRNWALLLLLPFDLALPRLSGRALAIYIKVRIAMALGFALLEIVGIIPQPLLPLAVLVAFPMSGLLSLVRQRAQDEELAMNGPAGVGGGDASF